MEVSTFQKVILLDEQGRDLFTGIQVSNTPELETRVILIDLNTGNILNSI